MEFGVFDHLDRGSAPLKEFYESRLKLIEAYDRAGFYTYHVAEHHSTPLGMAPSPTVFLSAVAQRTHRLRFGPLVYALPLHHPLRLAEEICMLDQLSGGRLDIGFGRGSSPMEIAFYGQDPKKAQNVYAEALEIILQGLASGKVDFEGEFLSFVPPGRHGSGAPTTGGVRRDDRKRSRDRRLSGNRVRVSREGAERIGRQLPGRAIRFR